MFTGIVEAIGTITAITEQGDALRISLKAPGISSQVTAGDSVAVNGICLTAIADGAADMLEFDAVRETMSRTTLSTWQSGTTVNLEQALTPQSRMGGHIVQGHIDGSARINRIEKIRTGMEMYFEAEQDYARYLVAKGSVAIDGVSLTIANVQGTVFRVALVPFTLDNTNLHNLKTGQSVNIETDILGRYIEQFLGHPGSAGGIDADMIRRSGFGKY